MFLENDIFNDCTVLLVLVTALMGRPERGETNTILSIIVDTYCVLKPNDTPLLQFKRLHRGWLKIEYRVENDGLNIFR